MATSTIVITYTPATGEASSRVTSMTVDGTAYASLTGAQVGKAHYLLTGAAKLILSEKAALAQSGSVGLKPPTS